MADQNSPAPADLVEAVADRIEQNLGPLFGSPEYLADPVKRARAEKRRREAAVSHALSAITVWQAYMASDGVVQADRDLFISISKITTDGATAEKINKGLLFTAEIGEIAAYRRATAVGGAQPITDDLCPYCKGATIYISRCLTTGQEVEVSCLHCDETGRVASVNVTPQADPSDAVIADLRRILKGWADWYRLTDDGDDCAYLNGNAWPDAQALADMTMTALAKSEGSDNA